MNKLWIIAALLVACARTAFADNEVADRIFPPPMPHREVLPPSDPFPGETNLLQEASDEFALYIPETWKVAESGEVALTIHFHGATWFAIQEHLRHGLKTPLLVFYPGEGSGKYQRAFADPERFSRLLKVVEDKLKEKGAPVAKKITSVSISSYGSGYGAIRELLKSDAHQKLIKRVVLADSIYADYVKDAEGNLTKTPRADQIDPYIPFAQAAAKGEKTFVVTFSQATPESYASTGDCVAAIAEKVGGAFEEIELDSSAAANDPDYPLVKRYDKMNLHLWGYAGADGPAHLTHAHHIADVWRELDEAKKP